MNIINSQRDYILSKQSISIEKADLLIQKSMELVDVIIHKFHIDYNSDFDKLIKDQNLSITHEDKFSSTNSYIELGYYLEPNQIYINTHGISKLQTVLMDRNVLWSVDLQIIVETHELFHVLEYLYKKEISTYYQTTGFLKLKSTRFKSIISELAAMEYTRHFLKIQDSLFVINKTLVDMMEENTI